jgi:ribulose-phosphate 3-epimerase
MQLYPSILTDSLVEFQKQLEWVAESEIETFQLDVVDGFFADNITVAPIDVAVASFQDLQMDVHLMVDEPMDFVYEMVALKEQLPIRAVIAQIEHMSFQNSYLEEVKHQGWKAGLSLDLATPVESIDEASWSQLDIVQLMGIQAGFQGQQFNPHILEKIDEVQLIIKQLNREIEIIIDGGVKPELIPKLKKAGVNSITMGSYLWQASDAVKTIQEVATQLD